MTTDAPQHSDRCGDCPIATNRRRFLRDAAFTAVATLIATGLRPDTALANLVIGIVPIRKSGPLRSYAVPPADAVMVDDENDVIITRYRGKVYAFSRRCPHKGARLEWHENEDLLFCPRHKARFTAGGDRASGRRSRNLDRYGLRQQGREIVVDTDTIYREDDDPQGWRSAVIAVRE